jgi:hypothetical protein
LPAAIETKLCSKTIKRASLCFVQLEEGLSSAQMSQSMAKLESGSDSDGINKASQNNVMFVDTSLDTHLALLVSDSDTVSDLKSNLILHHLHLQLFLFFCFFVCLFNRFLRGSALFAIWGSYLEAEIAILYA